MARARHPERFLDPDRHSIPQYDTARRPHPGWAQPEYPSGDPSQNAAAGADGLLTAPGTAYQTTYPIETQESDLVRAASRRRLSASAFTRRPASPYPGLLAPTFYPHPGTT